MELQRLGFYNLLCVLNVLKQMYTAFILPTVKGRAAVVVVV